MQPARPGSQAAYHSFGNPIGCVDTIAAVQNVLSRTVYKAYYWIVPARFTVGLQSARVTTPTVVVYAHCHEKLFQGVHNRRMGEHTDTEPLAGSTSWNLLKEEKDGLLQPFRLS